MMWPKHSKHPLLSWLKLLDTAASAPTPIFASKYK